jgi:hypothetical protein
MDRLYRVLLRVVVFALLLSPAHSWGADPVPPEYASLYVNLGLQLNRFDAALDDSSPVLFPRPLTFAADLVSANSHLGEQLLTPSQWSGTLLLLDRLQAVGVQGVKVDINYPVLSPWFARSDEYLAFYRNLADEIRRRHLTLLVQTQLTFTDPEFSPANCGTGFQPIQVDYSTMTFWAMAMMKKAYAAKIIAEIHPDYLTVATEPTTLASISGVTELKDPAKYRDMVKYILQGLDRGGVLVGAGAGTWDDLSFFSELIARTSLDYIDVHVYPVNYDFLERAISVADAARLYRKRLVIGETGLYKASNDDLNQGAGTSPAIFSRDVFSFWAPLDEAHVGLMAKLSRLKGYELLSPFYVDYWFAYLPYDSETSQMTPMDRLCRSYAASAQGIADGSLTEYGQYYRSLISTFPR